MEFAALAHPAATAWLGLFRLGMPLGSLAPGGRLVVVARMTAPAAFTLGQL